MTKFDTFWNDIKGIVDQLNKSNPDNPINDFKHPSITNYLLWRILQELKVNRKNTKELIKQIQLME